MKTPIANLLSAAIAVAVVLPTSIAAADFDSGSNGTYGPLAITANTTLDLPPDGILHCTSITVNSGSTLRFNRNPLNTPVVLLSQGDVVITGVIDVAGANGAGAIGGAGGPGGFDGGHGGFGPSAPANRGGDGHGPGGGVNADTRRSGAYANAAGANNRSYGNVLILPLIGGSGAAGLGGNPGVGGGGGGGAILIASNTRITVNGRIDARGGYDPISGGGSGGSIRLVSPTGGGGGTLRAAGSATGSEGRVRLDITDALAFRNIIITGSVTRGTRMFALPPPQPLLHLISVAGQSIPVGTASGVNFELPAGTPTAQTVVLRGAGFTGEVAVQLAVIPEHSASTTYDLVLNGNANPPEVTANVTLPVGESIRIEAWTK